MKKIVLIGGGVLVLLALIWGGIKFFGKSSEEDAEMDVSSGNVSAETDVSSGNADISQNDQADPTVSGSDMEGSVSGSDVNGAAEEETAAESSEEDILAEEAAFSDEDVLYTINTSAGGNLGMVPIVNGNAVVLMDGGSGVTYQGEYVPEEQSALQSKVNEVTASASSTGKIGAGAFYREAMLKDFTFPEGVDAVEKFAFARSNLQSVAIPEGVTSIGYGAFYHCDSLTDVTIPDTVTTIEENAFSHTPWLENWMVAGTGTASEEPAGDGNMADEGDFLIVGDGILLAYRGADADPELPAEVKSVVPGALNR